MPYSLETLAALATIFGVVLSVLALVQSRACLILTSLFFVGLAITAGLYGRRERLAREAASTIIEGYSIDSLNAANLRRRLDRVFVVQEAEHTACIEGEDLKIAWKYSGYCRVDGVAAFDFSIDTGAGTSFDELDCVAWDLAHDPDRLQEIKPILIGPEGMSKKISVPLLEPLRRNQAFRILLRCTLPECLTFGTGYYTSTLSFAQDRIQRYTVRLIFVGSMPLWIRVYDCSAQKRPVLVKSLVLSRDEAGLREYVDAIEEIPGRSARVYLFRRDRTSRTDVSYEDRPMR